MPTDYLRALFHSCFPVMTMLCKPNEKQHSVHPIQLLMYTYRWPPSIVRLATSQ